MNRPRPNDITFRFRPLSGDWPPDGKEHYDTCRFRAPYRRTLDDLRYELSRLGVPEAVIEIDVSEREIRLDGLPRADAHPASPQVRLSFDHPDLGPLQYPCDTYSNYQDNLRAIAKTLEAQRAMDRYGATRHHQQYAGWKALPGGEAAGHMTVEQAAGFMSAQHAQSPTVAQILRSAKAYRRAYRMAAQRLHPDVGGDADEFNQLQQARDVLHQHHGSN